jgi:hypothetical protein
MVASHKKYRQYSLMVFAHGLLSSVSATQTGKDGVDILESEWKIGGVA